MPNTFRHAGRNTNCPPPPLATFKTTVPYRKQPQRYCCLAGGSRGQCDNCHLKCRQYYAASCILVPLCFECILLVGLSPHCRIRRPSCPSSWYVYVSHWSRFFLDSTGFMGLCPIVPQNSVREVIFPLFRKHENTPFNLHQPPEGVVLTLQFRL